MDNGGQRLAALDHVDAARKYLLDQLVLKFSGPQLVNNFTIQLEPLFATYRNAVHNAALPHVASAVTADVLQVLWDTHTRVRTKFMQAMSKLSPHQHQPPSKPYRDTVREFISFIKSSQAGYKSLIRALHEMCPDVTILGNIAGSYLNGNGNTPGGTPQRTSAQNSRVFTVPEDKQAALSITRDSLIYLGDLSRWRHKAHVDKQSHAPQWRTAKLYYELAYEVDPSSGLAKHQLAVLAQDDNKYFPALASLYQSLASVYPHPQAANNLDRLINKHLNISISQMIPKVKPSSDATSAVATLRAWFLQLHVHFYRGVLFDQHVEMESEVLARLTQALKPGSGANLDGTLLAMALINMAAEWTALEHAKKGIRAMENAQMYFFCFRHNVKTFKLLLEHFSESLDAQARDSVSTTGRAAASSIPISGAALQTIRVYVLWFAVNWSFMQKCIETNTPEPDVAEDVRQLWRLLAHVLNGVYEQYPLFEIGSAVEHEFLVDEEEATMGFQPVHSEATVNVWWKDNGALKPVIRRERSAEEVREYNLVRIRDIYTRVLFVANEESSSLVINNDKLHFSDPGIFSPPPPAPLPDRSTTPPPTSGYAMDPTLYALPADGAVQDHPNPARKRLPVRFTQDSSSTPPLMPTGAVLREYAFPKQLPWIPERLQDSIWHQDDETMRVLTPWSTIPFASWWYGGG